MEVVFPSLDSPEFVKAFTNWSASVDALVGLFNRCGVRGGEPAEPGVFAEVLGAYNAVLVEAQPIRAYVHAFVTTDSRDELAKRSMSRLEGKGVELGKLGTRLTAWIGSQDVQALIDASPSAASHAFALRKARKAAEHLMDPTEEDLSADLSLSGGMAWGKLHGTVSSQIEVQVGGKTMPMSAARNLAYDPDRDVRRSGYEAELVAWKLWEAPIAAAMNGVKGEVGTLAKRRGWSPLEEALFHAHIDRETLDAMLSAARASFPDFRRYLKAKARYLGVERLAWYDLFAPTGKGGRSWSYGEGERFVAEQFGTYSPALQAFAERAFAERWVDAEPRPGKRDGAFCMGLRKDESRVLMNYKDAFGAVSTLAHELGHAYHNVCLAERTPLQKATPMTLAETASIFCETIIRHAALEQGSADDQFDILEAMLQGACQVVVDITCRFDFESKVFEGRAERELSGSELCNLMLDAQRGTYGDGLDPDLLHPYMWAMKPHYYSAGRSFYNFPYMFGLLFGIGLYEVYKKDPDTFRAGYDDLLSSTGLDDATALAAKFGIDIRSRGFWEAGLASIGRDIDRFESLVGDAD